MTNSNQEHEPTQMGGNRESIAGKALDAAGKKLVLDKMAKQAVDKLAPIAARLKGNPTVREYFGGKWEVMTRDEKVKTLQDPSVLQKAFGGPWYIKHKVDQYTLGGLVLIGAIGGSAEDESILDEVYSSTWAEKAIIALINIGKFLDPQLVPLAEGMNVYEALKGKGLEVCRAVRNQSAVSGVQEERHESAAAATPDDVVPPHQSAVETNNSPREEE